MEYENIKEWLDTLIADVKKLKQDSVFSRQIECSYRYESAICIPCGLEIVADKMGIELEESEIKSEYGFGYRYSFKYDGWEFVCHYSERLTRFRKEDGEDVPV